MSVQDIKVIVIAVKGVIVEMDDEEVHRKEKRCMHSISVDILCFRECW
jgi:hypothetical protein